MKRFKMKGLLCVLAAMACITAFPTTAYASAGQDVQAEKVTKEPGEALSEESDIVTRDLLYDKATNKQFLTIEDREGNIFYLVIDYDAPVNEAEEQYKTYFLNPVDTEDLAALAEKAGEEPIVCTCMEQCQPGKIDMNCPVCASNMTECIGTEPEPVEEPAAPVEEPVVQEKKAGINPAMLLLVFVILGGSCVAVYFKFFKGKGKSSPSADEDDYDYEEESFWEDADEEEEEK